MRPHSFIQRSGNFRNRMIGRAGWNAISCIFIAAMLVGLAIYHVELEGQRMDAAASRSASEAR